MDKLFDSRMEINMNNSKRIKLIGKLNCCEDNSVVIYLVGDSETSLKYESGLTAWLQKRHLYNKVAFVVKEDLPAVKGSILLNLTYDFYGTILTNAEIEDIEDVSLITDTIENGHKKIIELGKYDF